MIWTMRLPFGSLNFNEEGRDERMEWSNFGSKERTGNRHRLVICWVIRLQLGSMFAEISRGKPF